MKLCRESIERIQATKEIEADVWKDMVRFAVDDCALDVETFQQSTRTMEESYAEKWFSNQPLAKTKGGKWKKTFTLEKSDGTKEKVYVIPNAWTTAKSVVCTAINAGEPLMDGSTVLGQTAVAKAARSKSKVEKSPSERFLYHMHAASVLAQQNDLPDSTQDVAKEYMQKINKSLNPFNNFL